MSHRLKQEFVRSGMVHQILCPHTPDQIGRAERHHMSIVEIVHCLMFHSGVPNQFWVHAFQTSVYLMRPTLTFSGTVSPFFALFGTQFLILFSKNFRM